MKVSVVTGSRAEYGLLYWLLCALRDDPDFDLQLCVTGTHLAPEFGRTVGEIESDGFAIAERVEMLLSSDSRVGTAKSMGLATIGFADCFQRLDPDLVVVLGDRFEIFAAVQAAAVRGTPIAHLHGGELTEGAIDDALRHAITKLSHLHFAAAEPYRRRIIQLGEAPDRVFTVGALGVDGVLRSPAIDWEELRGAIGEAARRPFLLVTYHPETALLASPRAAIEALLAALDEFPDLAVVVTRSNADPGGRLIGTMIDDWAARQPERVATVASLGRLRYVNFMRQAEAIVGNSSSGIIEAPATGTPTVNIGDRQKGRLLAPSVFEAAPTKDAIVAGIAAARARGRRPVDAAALPYGAGGTAERIVRCLKGLDLATLVQKRFHDLPVRDEGIAR